MTTTITIRPATADDAPAMLTVESQSPGAGHWQTGDYARIFVSDSVRRVAFVADAPAESSADPDETEDSEPFSRKVIGFIVAQCLGPEWEIENVAVLPTFRGHGVGQRLVSLVLAMARNECAEAVYLEVRESNLAARRLYEKLGFTETGRRHDYYSAPLEDAVIYSFTISELLKNVENVEKS